MVNDLLRSLAKSKFTFGIHLGVGHVFAVIGLALIFLGEIKLQTIIFAEVLADFAGFGITVGAHRLWTHRCFKARTPLKILLATCFAFTGQGSLWL
ncbi:unnamed protein product, partial [Allacma fusca]